MPRIFTNAGLVVATMGRPLHITDSEFLLPPWASLSANGATISTYARCAHGISTQDGRGGLAVGVGPFYRIRSSICVRVGILGAQTFVLAKNLPITPECVVPTSFPIPDNPINTARVLRSYNSINAFGEDYIAGWAVSRDTIFYTTAIG